MQGREQAQLVLEYLRALTLCNEVVPLTPLTSSDAAVPGTYQGASPDETALVEAAARNGCVLMAREPGQLAVHEPGAGSVCTYKLVATLGFTSERRRMSVVVETPAGQYVVLCKGADMVMLPRCRARTAPDVFAATVAHMDGYAAQGYRTLVVARRVLSAEEFAAFSAAYQVSGCPGARIRKPKSSYFHVCSVFEARLCDRMRLRFGHAIQPSLCFIRVRESSPVSFLSLHSSGSSCMHSHSSTTWGLGLWAGGDW